MAQSDTTRLGAAWHGQVRHGTAFILTNAEAHTLLRKPHENENLSKAIQASFDCDTLVESVNYVCMWEQYHYRTKKEIGYEPNFGIVVAELLKLYGIDIHKIRRA